MTTIHYKMVKVPLTEEEIKQREEAAQESLRKSNEEYQKRLRESVPKEIARLKDLAKTSLDQAEKIEKLLQAYPDLVVYKGRWEKLVYASASVNGKVTHYETRYNCGCCPDSPLEIWTYIETDLGRVYSYPSEFKVADKGWDGDNPYPDWQERLRKERIPEEIIISVAKRFDGQKYVSEDPEPLV